MNARLFLLLFLMVVLTGCDGSVASDPASMLSEASQLNERARFALTATADMRMAEARQETKAAEATQDFLSIQQTSQALLEQRSSGEATATARFHEGKIIQATVGAVSLASTADSMQATSIFTVTQTIRNEELAARRQQIQAEKVQAWAFAIIKPLACLVGAGGLGVFLWRLGDWAIEWTNRRRTIHESRYGILVFTSINGEGQWVLVTDPPSRRAKPPPFQRAFSPEPVDGVRALTPSGSVLESPLLRNLPTNRLVERLLQQAIDQGWTGDQIPGWRNLEGWNSESWQRAIAPLRDLEIVETTSSGTFLTKKFESTCALQDAIRSRKIIIRPVHTNR